MSERRFWFVIDKGELDYVQDNVTKERITVTELEDLLNELAEDNRKLRQTLEQTEKRINYWQTLYKETLDKIPPKIKEVWIQ